MPKSKIQLNENQKKAVQHEKGPLLVVAGAGTGKTRVITERVRYLIQNKNFKPQEILALTFTEKAAAEMLDRIGDIMPLGYEEPWVSTFHSFADRVLKTEGLEIGLNPSYKVLPSSKQWLLLRRNIFKFDLDYFRPLGNPTKFISGALKFISRLQDEYILPEDLKKYVDENVDKTWDKEESQRWKELAHIYEKYTELKIEESKLDFGDLITWVIKLFQERPNILKKYQGQFKHVLVDEFQDTNYAQYELVKLLCPEKLDDRSLLVVGDDSQSIYKFRGAAVSNILEFMQDYPKAEMVTLLQNYRSTQPILDPTYRVIKNNNPDTLESKLGISKELVSEVGKKGPKPEIIRTETLEDEVDFVVSKIYEILAEEPQYTYKNFAILSRANSHLDPFVMALRQRGIPYQLVGNRGLYDRDEIRDILALLRVTINPFDGISLYRVLNIPSLEIPYEVIAKLLANTRYKKSDLWQEVAASNHDRVISLKGNLEEMQKNITKTTPTGFVYQLVHSIHCLDSLLEEESVESHLSIKNLDIFLNIIKRFEVEYHYENKEYPTIIDLVDYLDLMSEAGDSPAQAEIEDIDTVNLLTTHAAKGLEFPVVFMTNLTSDRFPTRNRSDVIPVPDELVKETLPSGDEHIQEERRLFYVGMTRAEKYLFMTSGKDYGGKREKRPSGFLEETALKVTEINSEDINKSKEPSLFGADSKYRDPGVINAKGFAPSFLSYSQIDTYLSCPLKYKYRYILQVPPLPSHALSFGTTIHDTLRDYHQRLMFEDVQLAELFKMYENNWQPLGYLNDEHRQVRYESGKKLLEDYYKRHNSEKIKHVALEKSFNIRIDGIKFFGRIDRIDKLPDGSVEIIDYKTGNPKDQKAVDKDMQVALYALGVKEALGLDPKNMSLYFVESGEKLTTSRTDEQLEEVKKQVVDIVGKIKKGEFDSTPGMHCNWCDYKEVCPFAYKG